MAQVSYVQAINQALDEELARDPLTFVMGIDVVLGAFGATRGLQKKYGASRVRNTPISEAGFVGAAVGAAMSGTRPICEVQFASFFYCAMDQVCNQAAKLRYMSGGQARMPLTFRCTYGAVGSAAAQHSETIYAQFLSVPGLKLAVPSSPGDVKGILKSAIRDDNPVIVFEHLSLGGLREEIPAGEHLVPLGKAAIKRPGDDVTVVAIGAMVQKALKAAENLAAEGISVEVVDPRTLIPLDAETILNSVAKTNRVVIADEGHLRGGAAADILAVIVDQGFDSLDAAPKRVTSLDVPIPFSPVLEKVAIASQAQIESAVRELAGGHAARAPKH
jgi:pyruvate/2-oxoglutarate/acetoin dehydrogenase E1 component